MQQLEYSLYFKKTYDFLFMRAGLSYLFLLLLCMTNTGEIFGQDTKAREKAIKRYWKNELKIARSTDHKKMANRYPGIGWLSGLWCEESKNTFKYYVHFEIKDEKNLTKATKGFTAKTDYVMFKPETVLYMESKISDMPIVVKNNSYYDLWSEDGKPNAQVRWFSFIRFKKLSDNSYERVYSKTYTIRDPKVDFAEFYKKTSPGIALTKHYKLPKRFINCN